MRLAAGVGLLAATLLGAVYPVAAKGPESATISGPGIERPIELMEPGNTEPVSRLMEQTGLWYGGGPRLQEAPPGELGPAYTLTWINGGPPGESVENRTIYQLIYLDAENGPLIHTPAQRGLMNWGPGVIGWYQAPADLPDTFAELGVPSASAPPFSLASFADLTRDPARAEWALAGVFRVPIAVGLSVLAGAVGVLAVRLARYANRRFRTDSSLPEAKLPTERDRSQS